MLSDAKLLIEKGRLRSAIDRAYSSIYHATQAILYTKGLKPKTHAGLKTLFGEHIVNKGIIDKEYGKILSHAFDMRQKSDYEIEAEFDINEVRNVLDKAEIFIKKIKEILK